jgi:hypothetical protein
MDQDSGLKILVRDIGQFDGLEPRTGKKGGQGCFWWGSVATEVTDTPGKRLDRAEG